MNPLSTLTTLALKVPVLRQVLTTILPTDKPWWQSTTWYAGIAWGAVFTIDQAGLLHGLWGQRVHTVALDLTVLSPLLMWLGIRKNIGDAKVAAAGAADDPTASATAAPAPILAAAPAPPTVDATSAAVVGAAPSRPALGVTVAQTPHAVDVVQALHAIAPTSPALSTNLIEQARAGGFADGVAAYQAKIAAALPDGRLT